MNEAFNSSDWYRIKNVDQIDSPALLFYPKRVKENIRWINSMVENISRIRPHVKTLKTKEPVRLMMKSGINKFKCATISEAEMLASCGAADILLAYQPTEVKFHRLIALMQAYPNSAFSCLVDNMDSGKLFSDLMVKARKNIGLEADLNLYMDINVGMDRTGIEAGKAAIELYRKITKLPGVILKGLHAYDGHINDIDLKKRTLKCQKSFQQLELMRSALKSKTDGLPLLIAGGSPTFSIHLKRENTQISPGTFALWDKGYGENIPELPFIAAALVLTRVISLPTADKICIDLGYKAITSENGLQKRVYFLNAPNLRPFSHSEEHMVLEAGPDHGWKPGDILYALPYHICPTVNLYDFGYCIKDGIYQGKWSIIARHRSIHY